MYVKKNGIRIIKFSLDHNELNPSYFITSFFLLVFKSKTIIRKLTQIIFCKNISILAILEIHSIVSQVRVLLPFT